MRDVVFVTGNDAKAAYLSRFLELPIEHMSLELDELQTPNLQMIVRHKLDQAYAHVGRPVLVEDVSLECTGLHGYPGTFIKWFLKAFDEVSFCGLFQNKDRSALARCMFGYFDGHTKQYFEGILKGSIAYTPTGDNGFGWDRIFIPEGYNTTRAALSAEDDRLTYERLKPLHEIAAFLRS